MGKEMKKTFRPSLYIEEMLRTQILWVTLPLTEVEELDTEEFDSSTDIYNLESPEGASMVGVVEGRSMFIFDLAALKIESEDTPGTPDTSELSEIISLILPYAIEEVVDKDMSHLPRQMFKHETGEWRVHSPQKNMDASSVSSVTFMLERRFKNFKVDVDLKEWLN